MSRDPRDPLVALLTAALLLTVLVCVPGLPHAFATPKDAVVCLAVAGGLTGMAFRRGSGLGHLPATLARPLVAWLGASVAASAAAGLWTHTLVMRGAEVTLFLVGFSVLGAPGARRRLLDTLVLTAVLESVLVVAQYVAGPAGIQLVGATSRRWYAFGTLGVPNWVGALAAMALPPALLRGGRRDTSWLAVTLLATCLLCTGSRGACVAAAVGVTLVARRLDRQLWLTVASGIGAAVLAVVLVGGSVARSDAGSIEGRWLIWRATIEMIHSHPLLGVGPGAFAGEFPSALHAVVTRWPRLSAAAGGFVDHAHDVPLQVAAESGLTGLLAFGWLLAVLAWRGASLAAGDRERAANLGTLAAFLSYAAVDDPFASSALATVAWLSAAALVATDTVAGPRLRPVLVGGAVFAAAYGLGAVHGDRALASAWRAASQGDREVARTLVARAARGPARGEADLLAGLLMLEDGEAAQAIGRLASSSRTDADPDVYYALAAAQARVDGPSAGLDTLRWLATALPRLTGPWAMQAELRLAAGEHGDRLDEALLRTIAQPAPLVSPRLEVFEAAAVAQLRTRFDGSGPAGGRRTRPLVVIDPGHGGTATGARAEAGTAEKTVTLQLAKRLAATLRAGGARVALTRARDRDVSLDARARVTNRLRPDLFVSLHANAAPNLAASGVEFHVRSVDSQRWPFPGLTARDAVVLQSIAPITLATAVAAQHALDRCALVLTSDVAQSMTTEDIATRGAHESDLYLLERVQAPALLVEVGFLSNPREARELTRPSWQRRVTSALGRAAQTFLARRGACGSESPAVDTGEPSR